MDQPRQPLQINSSSGHNIHGATPTKERFDLKIKITTSDTNAIIKQSSFVLTKVKRKTTVFEIKQAIEKLKYFKIETQSLKLPDHLKQFLPKQDHQSISMEDERSLDSYQVFDILPRTQSAQSQDISLERKSNSRPPTAYLYLELQSVQLPLSVNLAHSMQTYKQQRQQQQSPPQLLEKQGATGGSQTLQTIEDELDLIGYVNTSIYCLKFLIFKKLGIQVQDQVLTFGGQTLDNSKELQDYEIKPYHSGQKKIKHHQKTFELNLIVFQKRSKGTQSRNSSQSLQRKQAPTPLNLEGSPMNNNLPPVPRLNLSDAKHNQSLQLNYHSQPQGNVKPRPDMLLSPLKLDNQSMAAQSQSNQFSVTLGIDFTFNTIKNVKKVTWKDEAPWFREISDGFCWLAYCHNSQLSRKKLMEANARALGGPGSKVNFSSEQMAESPEANLQCPAFKELVVINRGYEVFSLRKDQSNGALRCPLCRTSKFLKVRNCGFVNCEWSMRGILKKNKESKIYAEGRTYDNKLYTFKECDYNTVWHSLDIMAKVQDPAKAIQNIPYPTSNDFKNREFRLQQKLSQKKQLQNQNTSQEFSFGTQKQQKLAQDASNSADKLISELAESLDEEDEVLLLQPSVYGDPLQLQQQPPQDPGVSVVNDGDGGVVKETVPQEESSACLIF